MIITLACALQKNVKKWGFGSNTNDFCDGSFLKLKNQDFQNKKKLQKSIKFKCKMVDNHWDQLVLGNQFWSY